MPASAYFFYKYIHVLVFLIQNQILFYTLLSFVCYISYTIKQLGNPTKSMGIDTLYYFNRHKVYDIYNNSCDYFLIDDNFLCFQFFITINKQCCIKYSCEYPFILCRVSRMQWLGQKLYAIFMLIEVARLLSKKTVIHRNVIFVHLDLQ